MLDVRRVFLHKPEVVFPRFLLGAVIPLDRIEDVAFGGQRGRDARADHIADRRQRLEIERVGHGHPERRLFPRQRQEQVLPHVARRNALDFRKRFRKIFRGQQGDFQLLGQSLDHVFRSREPQIDQNPADLVAALFLQLKRLLQIPGIHKSPIDQHLAQPFGQRDNGK